MGSTKKENRAMKDISRQTGFTHVSQIQFEQENADMHDAMEDQFSRAMRLYEDKGATYDTIVGFRHKLAFGLVSAVSLIFEDANRLVAFTRTDSDTALRDKMLDMLNHIAVALVLLDERLERQERMGDIGDPAMEKYFGGGLTADRYVTSDGKVFERVEPSADDQVQAPTEQVTGTLGRYTFDKVPGPLPPEDEEPLPVEPEALIANAGQLPLPAPTSDGEYRDGGKTTGWKPPEYETPDEVEPPTEVPSRGRRLFRKRS